MYPRSASLRKNADCPVCGDHPTITKLIDYQEFCGIVPHEAAATDADIDPVQVKAMIDRREPFVLIDVPNTRSATSPT